jgi:hypothetical protein
MELRVRENNKVQWTLFPSNKENYISNFFLLKKKVKNLIMILRAEML